MRSHLAYPSLILAAALLAVQADAARLVSPVAVPFASGPAFPQGRKNGNPPDPQYAAASAIDGDPATFCCLLDDTLTGKSASTIPANASAPVTGHMVFDLGDTMVVFGAKITSRKGGVVNPEKVDFFYFADDDPANNAIADDIEHDGDIKALISGRTLRRLGNRASETVTWDGVVARYIGLRVNSSYESGRLHHNFQMAEIELIVSPKPTHAKPGMRVPPIYVKKPTLPEPMLAIRAQFTAWFGQPSAESSSIGSADGLWDRLRKDFPRATYRMVDYIHFEWFGDSGWFGRPHSTDLEERTIRRAAEGSGAAGDVLLHELLALCRTNASAEDRRWLDLCVKAADVRAIAGDVRKLRLAVRDLTESFPNRYPGDALLARLDDYEREFIQEARSRWEPAAADAKRLADDLNALKRYALVVRNPLLAPSKVLFVKRYTYTPGYYYANFMTGARRFGGNLCVLSLPDGKVAELVPEMAGGIFDRYDLSFDGERVVFGYRRKPGTGFRLYEVGIDGGGRRQLTFDPPGEEERMRQYWHPRYKSSGIYKHHTDDFHPCYLPDGGICFASTRCERGVLCDQGDSLAVNTLYRMNADGSDLHILSEGALSESTPSVMNDGRVLYTRWEYVDKGVIAVQALWAMRPDGTGTVEVYGDEIEDPPVLIHGRVIPGDHNRLVCTATMHHPFEVGPILLIDTGRDLRSHEPIRSLTPDTSLSIEGVGGYPRGEAYTHWRNGRWVRDNMGPLFADPYPLHDSETGAGAGKYFLVTCNPDRSWSHASAYGIWLIDAFGNRVAVHHDPEMSCWQPIPLRARKRPPVIPPCIRSAGSLPRATPTPGSDVRGAGSPRSRLAVADTNHRAATVVMSDVYEGLDGVERGTIRYLRIFEQVGRPWSARRFWPQDSAYGQHAIISLYAHIYVKILHGVVPVHEDGSAHFTVPTDKNLFFQALDGDFMEVQRMRTFVNFQPGESRSCIGCHERHESAPPPKSILALRRLPARPLPQPGDTAPRPLHYPTDVQPILDKHCTRCHSGKEPKAKLDLSGEMTPYFCRSYENIMRRKLVTYIQEFHGPQPRAQKTNVVPLPPRSLGSHASKLITQIRKDHHDVALSREELIRLVTWADANAPYYGSYFGRRNLIYRDHPDFRPVPTLASAMGVSLDDRLRPQAEGGR